MRQLSNLHWAQTIKKKVTHEQFGSLPHWRNPYWTWCNSLHGSMGAVSQTRLQDYFTKLLFSRALASVHARWNLYAFKHCIGSAEERRMHDRMDRPLHDWRYIFHCFYCTCRQQLASTPEADSRNYLRGRHSFGAILHHATCIWTRIGCIKDVKSYAGKISQFDKSYCVWHRSLPFWIVDQQIDLNTQPAIG